MFTSVNKYALERRSRRKGALHNQQCSSEPEQATKYCTSEKAGPASSWLRVCAQPGPKNVSGGKEVVCATACGLGEALTFVVPNRSPSTKRSSCASCRPGSPSSDCVCEYGLKFLHRRSQNSCRKMSARTRNHREFLRARVRVYLPACCVCVLRNKLIATNAAPRFKGLQHRCDENLPEAATYKYLTPLLCCGKRAKVSVHLCFRAIFSDEDHVDATARMKKQR